MLLALVWRPDAFAEAQLMVSPTRVLFEGAERTAEVTLINSGTSRGTYRISFERKRMTDEGAYLPVPENQTGMFADPYIRFSPRQVSLEPGQSQTVRLLLRKPGELPQGEYRSHMLFQAIPDATTTDIEEQLQTGKKGVTVRLIPILGISIPVIVRQGKLEAQAKLSELVYQSGNNAQPPLLSVTIARSGNRSLYGDVIVRFQPQNHSQVYVVGMAKGIAVYTPNTMRKVSLHLQQPQGMATGEGVLTVEYRQPASEGGKLLASSQTTITINN